MISRDKSPDVGGFPIRRSTQLLHAVALGLLLGSFVAIAAPAQGKPAASKSKQNTRNTKPTKPALPSTIQAANGESIPVSELIPRTESATQQVEKIVANLDNPEIKQAEASLDVMSKAISGTAEETKKSIRLARSPLQLTEARVAWKRNRAELDVISLAVVGYAADLTQQNQQLLKLRETWTAAAKSAIDAKLTAAIH